jgi:hypothetical protein
MGAVYIGCRLARRRCGYDPDDNARRRRCAGRLPREEGLVLKEGDMSPKVVGTSYDGVTIDLGAPGRRTVLWFYPKANTGG